MAKNLLFLIVDSVYQKRLSEQDHRHSPTPFLKELGGQSLVLERMFSQAPFTEAALSSLLCGEELLNSGGYIQRLKYKQTVMEEFSRHGYETFANHLAPQSYPGAMFPGIEVLYHQSYYVFREFWDYRLCHYQKLFPKRLLSEIEHSLVKDLLAENLEAWMDQLMLLIRRDPSVEILTRSSSLAGVEEELETVRRQYQLFVKSPDAFLDGLFARGEEHPLFRIPKRTCDRRVPAEVQEEVRRRYRPVFERIYRLNRDRNLKNLRPPMGRVARCLGRGDSRGAGQYLRMYREAIWDGDLFERIGENYTTFRASIPMRSYIDHFLNWYDGRQDPDRPLFTYLHVDDAHTPETFFTWDSSDFHLLDQEFGAITRFLDDLPQSYRGSLSSDLSLQYVDGCVRYLFEELGRRGVLEDTAVVLMADHGFSFAYDPIRQVHWNNFHLENYNPPFLLYEQGRTGGVKRGFFMEKDVAPTLLDLCGLPTPPWMTGESILGFEGRDFTLIEYTGEGCPDLLRRAVLLGARTVRYLVVVRVHLQQTFEKRRILEVYDLREDPLEMHNLAGRISQMDIRRELEVIRQRFEMLRQNFETTPNAFHTPEAFETRIGKVQNASGAL